MSFQHSPGKQSTCTPRQQPLQIWSQSSRNQEITACHQMILYQLGRDLLSGEALKFQATLNFKWKLFLHTHHVYTCPNEKWWECCTSTPSFFWAADFDPALLLLTTRPWTITAQKNWTSSEKPDCTCLIWHSLTTGPDDSYSKASQSAETCKPFLPVFSLCVVVCSFQTCD